MPAFICTACGTQYPLSEQPPKACPICEDERQFVPEAGQSWTTLEAMRGDHFAIFRQHEPGLIGMGTTPKFAIGQRALLVATDQGNVMWDCMSFIDPVSVALVRGLGGIRAIAMSHPHFYASMIEWSEAFGHAPIYLHSADRNWVMRPDPAIIFWDEETREIASRITLLRAGGHFAGATMLHWAAGAGGRGALLASDIATVGLDNHVSFMRSYPCLIPLDQSSVRHIAEVLKPWRFERIYGGWFERGEIKSGGKDAVASSVARYLKALTKPPD
ncbi:MAG: MBL fold metallo-hydrolase [Acetobacteraceae bacterium]